MLGLTYFEKSNMPARAQNSGACKKYVEISLLGGEKQIVEMQRL